MDTIDKKIEIELAKRAVEQAGLYVAGESDLDRLAWVAADAYRDYPLHNWLSNGRYDERFSALLMKVTLKTMLADAIIYADSKEINGYAVWLPAGYSGTKALPFLMNGGFRLMLYKGPGIIRKLVAYDEHAMGQKKTLTNHRDWYLYNISVKKDAQGKGIAGKLMAPMLQVCDDELMMVYLETHRGSNVGFYRHYGFELASEAKIPKTSLTHYAMVRRPNGPLPSEDGAGRGGDDPSSRR